MHTHQTNQGTTTPFCPPRHPSPSSVTEVPSPASLSPGMSLPPAVELTFHPPWESSLLKRVSSQRYSRLPLCLTRYDVPVFLSMLPIAHACNIYPCTQAQFHSGKRNWAWVQGYICCMHDQLMIHTYLLKQKAMMYGHKGHVLANTRLHQLYMLE